MPSTASKLSKMDKREPLPYWVDIQADLSLCWSHRPYCKFCRALAHIVLASKGMTDLLLIVLHILLAANRTHHLLFSVATGTFYCYLEDRKKKKLVTVFSEKSDVTPPPNFQFLYCCDLEN